MSSVDTTQITHFFSSFTLAKLPPAIITFIIAYAASRVVLKVADKLFARSRMEKTIEKFLRSALRILMWALIWRCRARCPTWQAASCFCPPTPFA